MVDESFSTNFMELEIRINGCNILSMDHHPTVWDSAATITITVGVPRNSRGGVHNPLIVCYI